MIEYVNLDITTITRGVVAQGVNCQRVMGSGVAKAIRDKWPQVYDSYKNFMPKLSGQQLLGRVNVVDIAPGLVVCNCFTQVYYGKDGKKYADATAIRESLAQTLLECYNFEDGNLPFYMPKLGCGLGGLNWDVDVRPTIEEFSTQLQDIDIFVCEWVK